MTNPLITKLSQSKYPILKLAIGLLIVIGVGEYLTEIRISEFSMQNLKYRGLFYRRRHLIPDGPLKTLLEKTDPQKKGWMPLQIQRYCQIFNSKILIQRDLQKSYQCPQRPCMIPRDQKNIPNQACLYDTAIYTQHSYGLLLSSSQKPVIDEDSSHSLREFWQFSKNRNYTYSMQINNLLPLHVNEGEVINVSKYLMFEPCPQIPCTIKSTAVASLSATDARGYDTESEYKRQLSPQLAMELFSTIKKVSATILEIQTIVDPERPGKTIRRKVPIYRLNELDLQHDIDKGLQVNRPLKKDFKYWLIIPYLHQQNIMENGKLIYCQIRVNLALVIFHTEIPKPGSQNNGKINTKITPALCVCKQIDTVIQETHMIPVSIPLVLNTGAPVPESKANYAKGTGTQHLLTNTQTSAPHNRIYPFCPDYPSCSEKSKR